MKTDLKTQHELFEKHLNLYYKKYFESPVSESLYITTIGKYSLTENEEPRELSFRYPDFKFMFEMYQEAQLVDRKYIYFTKEPLDETLKKIKIMAHEVAMLKTAFQLAKLGYSEEENISEYVNAPMKLVFKFQEQLFNEEGS